MRTYNAADFDDFNIRAEDDTDAIAKASALKELSWLPAATLQKIANRREAVKALVDHSTEKEMQSIADAVNKDPGKIKKAVQYLKLPFV